MSILVAALSLFLSNPADSLSQSHLQSLCTWVHTWQCFTYSSSFWKRCRYQLSWRAGPPGPHNILTTPLLISTPTPVTIQRMFGAALLLFYKPLPVSISSHSYRNSHKDVFTWYRYQPLLQSWLVFHGPCLCHCWWWVLKEVCCVTVSEEWVNL